MLGYGFDIMRWGDEGFRPVICFTTITQLGPVCETEEEAEYMLFNNSICDALTVGFFENAPPQG